MFTVFVEYISRRDGPHRRNLDRGYRIETTVSFKQNKLRSFDQREDAVAFAQTYRKRLQPSETLYITNNDRTVHALSSEQEWIH